MEKRLVTLKCRFLNLQFFRFAVVIPVRYGISVKKFAGISFEI